MSDTAAAGDDRYRVEYTSEATDFLYRRRAATHAAFFLPYLRAGMRLLDCGCGPGSITADLAEIVRPAPVMGIDLEPKQVALAERHAAERQLSSLRFQVGDIARLPFPDESFDAVFIHGVVEYLGDPAAAFREVHRVLARGGVLGTRHGDWGGFLIAPADPLVEEFFVLFQRFMRHGGGDPHFGRNQLAALRAADFRRVVVSASYDCWTDTEERRRSVGHFLASYCVSPEFVQPVQALSLADEARLREISGALRRWGADETAFAAEAWGEAVAWKE